MNTNFFRRTLTTLTLVALSVLPMWADEFTVAGFTYETLSGNQVQVAGTTKTGILIIPETVTYSDVTYRIVGIKNEAFINNNKITKVTIPNSVITIGEKAFSGCSGITSLNIPESVTSLGAQAFASCSALTSITLPSSITEIPDYLFASCSKLQYIGIPNSVKQIGSGAFQRCSTLTSITLPEGLTSMGSAFYECSSLRTIKLPSSLTEVSRYLFYACSHLQSVELPNTIQKIGDHAFAGCSSLSSIVIPKGVTELATGAFSGCYSLNSIQLPSTLLIIGESAFSSCTGMTSIILPENLNSLGDNPFYNCKNLMSIYSLSATPPTTTYYTFNNIPSGVVKYVKAAALSAYKSANRWSDAVAIDKQPYFQPTFSLDNYQLTISTKTTGATVYYTTDGTEPTTASMKYTAPISFTQNDTVRAIAVHPNYNNSFVSVFYSNLQVPNPIAVLSEDFVVTMLCNDSDIPGLPTTKIYYKLSVTSGNSSWGGGAYVESPVPEVAEIDDEWHVYQAPFKLPRNCRIFTYAERDGWTKSEQITYDFYNNYSLTTPSIDWDAETKTITLTHTDEDVQIFYTLDGSDPTEESTLYLEPLTINRNLIVKAIAVKPYYFNSGVTTETITGVDSKFYQDGIYYQLIDNTLANEVEVTSGTKYSGIKTIPGMVTYNGVTYTVTAIGKSAFKECTGLTAITIPNTVSRIKSSAFYGCTSLPKVSIPKSVKEIEASAFYNCKNLQNVTLQEGLLTIGGSAFYNCIQLQSMILPKTLMSIGSSTFSNCFAMKSIDLPESVTSIGEKAFYYCSSLLSIKLPSSLESIESGTFSGCSNLQSVFIPNSIKEIKYSNEGAFRGCSKLPSIAIPEGVTSIPLSTFSGCTSLTTVSLPSTLTTIGSYAFYNCSSLTNITLPENLNSIGDNAFSGCGKLKSVYSLPVTPPTLVDGNAFTSVVNQSTLYVKDEAMNAYRNTNYWGEFSSINALDRMICAQPAFVFDNYQLVMSTLTAGASIFYTTDGSDPTESSIEYTGPIPFLQNDTIRAITHIAGMDDSPISEYRKDDYKVATPVVSLSEDFMMTITCETPDVEGMPETKIYYREKTSNYGNGSNYGSWILYEGPVQMTHPKYIQSYATRQGWNDASTQSADYYTNYYLSAPTIAWDAETKMVTLTHSNSEVRLYYTLDGSDPTTDSQLYTAPFTLSRNLTVKVIAAMEGHFNSAAQYRTITGIDTKFEKDGIYYQLIDNTTANEVEVTSGDYPDYARINIPKTVTHEGVTYTVRRIGRSAFNYKKVSAVTIPNTVDSIGDLAFYYCSALESIVIPNGVTTIPSQCFYDCTSLKSITLPSNLVNINDYAFESCSNLLNITFPATVKTIGYRTFRSCSNLQSITLPSTLMNVGREAFAYCYGLSSVYCMANNPLQLVNADIFDGVTSKATLFVPKESLNAYQSAEVWKSFSSIKSMERIPCDQPVIDFSGYMLTMTTRTEGAKIYYTIDGTEPTTISQLYTAPIPIRQNATIRAVSVCEGYDNSPVSRYNLEVVMPRPVITVSDDFLVTISCEKPDAPDFPIPHIYYCLFPENYVPTKKIFEEYEGPIRITNSTYIYAYAASEGCTDSPSSSSDYYTNYFVAQPTIDWNAESKMLTMSHSDEDAMIFYTLDDSQPSTASTLYTEPFEVGRNVIVRAVAYKTGKLCSQERTQIIKGIDSRIYIDGIYYKLTDNSSANEVEITNGAAYIGDITIPETVTFEGKTYTVVGVGPEAFRYCTGLSSISLPASLRYIGNYAFTSCNKLVEIDLSKTQQLTSIGYEAFYNLSNLESIDLPNTLTSIGTSAFSRCYKLKSISIPAGIKEIQNNTFSYCSQLQTIVIPESVKAIGNNAFYECKISSINLPEGITEIPQTAFYGCTKLESITLPSTITKIGSSAFVGCSVLNKVYCTASTPPTLESNSFEGVTDHATLYVKDYAKAAYEEAPYWVLFSGVETYGNPSAAKPVFAYADYKLTITSETDGAKIYYTTDGSKPTTKSQLYTAPLAFVQNDTIQAIAVCEGYDDSPVETFMKRNFKVATPVANLSADLKMTITCEDAEGLPSTRIYYQKNSEKDNTSGYGNWLLYTEPVQLAEAGHVRVRALRDGWLNSDWGAFDFYTDYNLKSPVINGVAEKKTVVISHEDNDVKIYYTLDGSEPTTSSTLYTDSIKLSQNTTVKTIAVKDHHFNSLPTTEELTWFTVAEPVISISKNVATITCETPGKATIYYTLDGSKPTSESTKYEAPFVVKTDGTIRALAMAEHWNNSPATTYRFRFSEHTCQVPQISRYATEADGSIRMTTDSLFITSETEDAVFYYTLDGKEPTTQSMKYENGIKLTENGLVKVIATRSDMINSSMVRQTVDWFTVETPKIAFNGKYCTITTGTEGATIYYTIDGSNPTTQSILYNEPFVLPAQQTNIKTIAVRSNWYNSDQIARTYYPGGNTCEAPVIARIAGTDSVQISTRTEGATIYYTTNGLNPTTNDQVYEKPIAVTKNGTLKAMVTNPIYYDSDITTFEASWFKAEQPVIAVDGIFVTITSPQEGTIIYYTLDGSEPTENSTRYENRLTMKESCTVKAVAVIDGFSNSATARLDYRAAEHTCATPTFARNGNQVTITSSPAEGTTIYYTIDGSEPTTGSSVYAASLEMTGNCTIKAIAKNDKLFTSETTSMEVNWFKVETPVIALDGIYVTITCVTPNTRIYYTLDGTTPTEESLRYASTFAMTGTCTIKAIAVRDNFNNSAIAMMSFDKSLNTAGLPAFARNGNKVTITSSPAEGTTIYYTIDGSEPNESSKVYGEPIGVNENCVIKAYATNPKLFKSDVVSYNTNWFTVETPVLATNGIYVTMTCATENAHIYYTLDGSTPSTESLRYEGQLTMTESCTIKAIAIRENYNNSSVVTRSFNKGQNTAAKPLFQRDGDQITITSTNGEGTTIYYTLDGTEPNTASDIYTAPITVTENGTIKAFAAYPNLFQSETSSYEVTWFKVEAPVVTFDGINVTMTCATPNSRIYYTLDGSTPSEESARYTKVVTMTGTCTLKAVAVRDNFNNSAVSTHYFDKESNTAGTPQFKRNGNLITITSATALDGTVIYYTTDGSDPDNQSNVYTAPVEMTENGTIKAIAINEKQFTSAIGSYEAIWFKVEAPVIALSGNSAIITCSTPGATIYYAFNENPTQTSTVYKAPVALVDNRVIRAYAVKKNYSDSEMATYQPDLFVCEEVTFAYNGRYLQMQTGEGMTIHYTTDGSKPTDESAISTGQLEIDALCTIRAIATRKDFRDSQETSYTIDYLYNGEDVDLNEAGKLEEVFQWIGGTGNIETLPVKGKLNQKDLTFISNIKTLRHLDLSEAQIEGDRLEDEAFANLDLITFSSPKQLSSVGEHLFKGCKELAAIVWNANQPLPQSVTEDIKNPNMLLYVNSRLYVPENYHGNIISGGEATSITLNDAPDEGNFCCPQRFYTQRISYTHNYSQTTKSGTTRGWETLALPFDVQTITHENRGALAPFAKEADMAAFKPFWLYELQETGFTRAAEIKAYTPYIVSMPNDPDYADDYILAGNVTFSATGIFIESDTSRVTMKGNVQFAPAMQSQKKGASVLAINKEDCTDSKGKFHESGSAFLEDTRDVRPFEAFALVNAAGVKAMFIGDYLWGGATDIRDAEMMQLKEIGKNKGIYDMSGKLLSPDSNYFKEKQRHRNIFIINGQKTRVK